MLDPLLPEKSSPALPRVFRMPWRSKLTKTDAGILQGADPCYPAMRQATVQSELNFVSIRTCLSHFIGRASWQVDSTFLAERDLRAGHTSLPGFIAVEFTMVWPKIFNFPRFFSVTSRFGILVSKALDLETNNLYPPSNPPIQPWEPAKALRLRHMFSFHHLTVTHRIGLKVRHLWGSTNPEECQQHSC